MKIADGISAGMSPSCVNTVCDSSWQRAFWERAFGILTFPFKRRLQFIFCQYTQLQRGYPHKQAFSKAIQWKDQPIMLADDQKQSLCRWQILTNNGHTTRLGCFVNAIFFFFRYNFFYINERRLQIERKKMTGMMLVWFSRMGGLFSHYYLSV